MQEIRRQKEKLEEKIMDIYRTPGHSPAKRTRGRSSFKLFYCVFATKITTRYSKKFEF